MSSSRRTTPRSAFSCGSPLTDLPGLCGSCWAQQSSHKSLSHCVQCQVWRSGCGQTSQGRRSGFISGTCDGLGEFDRIAGDEAEELLLRPSGSGIFEVACSELRLALLFQRLLTRGEEL